jgi:acetyl esterase/lipase
VLLALEKDKISLEQLDLKSRLQSVQYGTHRRMGLDIFPPIDKGGRVWKRRGEANLHPTILFFYGGSWKKGNRRLYSPLGLALSQAGYAVAIADYRLYPEIAFPDFMMDAAAALSWLQAFAPTFGGDPADITLMGHSAGAHMGALLCLDPSYLETENLNPKIIKRYIGLAGPYSVNLHRAGSVAPIFDHFNDKDKTRPIKLISKDQTMPPSLLLHGEADKTVNRRNTENFATAIGQTGGKVQTHYYPNVGHVGLILTLAPGLRWRAPSWDNLLHFLAQTD